MTVKEERKTNNGTNVLFERTVCEMNATEKNLVIIIYIYVNIYMKKSVGREEDLSWFDLQECLPRLFQLLVQTLLLSHFLTIDLVWILNTKANSNRPHGRKRG